MVSKHLLKTLAPRPKTLPTPKGSPLWTWIFDERFSWDCSLPASRSLPPSRKKLYLWLSQDGTCSLGPRMGPARSAAIVTVSASAHLQTASFIIPTLNRIDTTRNHIQALLLVPTRELALQTAQVVKTLGAHIPNLQVMCTTGGSPVRDDILRLQETVHVLVGTPGRVEDFAMRGVADLRKCTILVLDEADKLLSEGMVVAVQGCIQACPHERQIMLFSATFPWGIKEFSVCRWL